MNNYNDSLNLPTLKKAEVERLFHYKIFCYFYDQLINKTLHSKISFHFQVFRISRIILKN